MGLHHLHPHLSEAVREIHRLLRKGGVFCFTEPHQESAFSRLRAIWYRHDSLFADNEESLDIEVLKREFESLFEFRLEKHMLAVQRICWLQIYRGKRLRYSPETMNALTISACSKLPPN